VSYVQYFSGGLVGMEAFGLSQESLIRQTIGLEIFHRVGGTLGHPNALAKYLVVWLPVNFALLFAPLPLRFKVILFAVFTMALSAELLTFSRGGWISFTLAGGITCAWCLAKRTKRGFSATLLVVTVLVVLIITLPTLVKPVQRRLFEEDYGAAKARKPLMVVAWNVIRHHPWLGVGLGNYAHEAVKYDNSHSGITKKFPHPTHNAFLLIAAELGLPALTLFLLIIASILCQLFRMSRARDDPVIAMIAIGLFAGVVGLLAHLQIDWEYLLFMPRYWFLFGLIQAMVEITGTGRNATNR
jgi:O-antigen ligase